MESSDRPGGRGVPEPSFRRFDSSPLPLPFGLPVGCRSEVGPVPGWAVLLGALEHFAQLPAAFQAARFPGGPSYSADCLTPHSVKSPDGGFCCT